MIGNLGLTALTALGAPFPLPQVVTAAVLFLLSWQLRPVVFSAFGPLLGLTLMAVVVVGGSWPMRRPRIGGRAPHRWVLGHVNLQLGPRAGRRLGGRVGFGRPCRVGGLAWVIPAATTSSAATGIAATGVAADSSANEDSLNDPGRSRSEACAAAAVTASEPSHRPPRQVQPAGRSKFTSGTRRRVTAPGPAAPGAGPVVARTSGPPRAPDLVGVGASGTRGTAGTSVVAEPVGPKSNLEVMRSLLS